MKTNIIFYASLVAIFAAGFYVSKLISPKGQEFALNYENCMKECDKIPQTDTLKVIKKACIDAVPKPNITVCFHVPPQNQQACLDNLFNQYEEKIQPCHDAYDIGVNDLEKCWRRCRGLLQMNVVKPSN